MKIVKLVMVLLLGLIIVMAVKTLTFTSVPHSLKPLLNDSTIDKEAVAARLSSAISFATVSTLEVDDTNHALFEDFHRFLFKSFPLIHQQLALELVNGHGLLYRWQGSDDSLKPILFLSHQDVVPVDQATIEQWQYPPFAGVIADGIIWGRGAIDIKSGVMGSLEAVENLLHQGFKPTRTVYLAFGQDEEVGGNRGAQQIAALFRDRNITFEFILDEGGSIVSDGVIPGVKRPVAMIGIAEKGYVSLKLTVQAVGGHASMPPQHTALGVIAQALVDLENNPFPSNFAYSKQLFRNIGPAMSGFNKAIFANIWLTQPLVEHILSGNKTTNATIRTTTAVTMAQGSSKDNILPSEASAVVNFRIMPQETVASVINYVTNTIDNEQIVITQHGGFGNEPSSVSVSDNANFDLIRESIYRVTQDGEMVVTPYLVMGGTDATHYSGLSDSIYRFAFNRFTPATLERMHGINEQIAVDDYVDTIRFFRELILGANSELN